MKLLFFVPLLLSIPAPFLAAAENAAPEEVVFYSDDGVALSGVFFPPSGPDRTTFILLHGLGSVRGEWDVFARQLTGKGYGVLSYDARGHGKSTSLRDGTPLHYTSFGPPRSGSPWERMVSDVRTATRFLARKKIARNRVGLIGASLGANVCLAYAASDRLATPVILLSPGIQYAGIGTADAVTAFVARPIALVAAKGDAYAYRSSSLLYQRIKENPNAAFMTAPAGHGVEMFEEDLEQRLFRWMRKYAP